MSPIEHASSKKTLKIHVLGAAGENYAAQFLAQQGFRLLAQNYKTRLGEVDLIVQQGNTVAFVEVKTRTSHYFHSSLLITPAKQRRIAKAAQQFILDNRMDGDLVLRFDTVFVSLKENAVDFEYIPNAFYAPSQEHR